VMPLRPDRCPLCGEANGCAAAAGGAGAVNCWCMGPSFPKLAPAAVAAALPGRAGACVCQACLEVLAALPRGCESLRGNPHAVEG
jgi:Cysteine-rich CWC